MDSDDPEKHIVDLERQLADQKRGADLGSPNPGKPGAPAAGTGESTRCLLSAYPTGWQRHGMAIDMSQDAIWVWAIDSGQSALLASAPRAQVTATPAAFVRAPKRDSGNTQPVLMVRVPGLQPLTIGCAARIGTPRWPDASSLRFWWRGKVPWVRTPAYVTAAPDWLTLVESFGLAPYLEDKESAQPDAGARWIASPQEVAAAAETGRDRPVMTWFFMTAFTILALGAFFFSALDFYRYQVGTPTTATVTSCVSSYCNGTWTIGGVPHNDQLPQKAPVGSTVDAHVSNGKAHSATTWQKGVLFGGGFLLIVIVVYVVGRSRTGTLIEKP